jgi:hypothetical protein
MAKMTTTTVPTDPTDLDVDDDPRVREARGRVADLSAKVRNAHDELAAAQGETRVARKALEDLELDAALAQIEGRAADCDTVRAAEARYRAALDRERPAARLVEAAQRLHEEARAGVEAVEIEALRRVRAALHARTLAGVERLRALLEQAAVESQALEAIHRQAEERFPERGPRGALRSRAGIGFNGEVPYFAWPELRRAEESAGAYLPSRLSGWCDRVDEYRRVAGTYGT